MRWIGALVFAGVLVTRPVSAGNASYWGIAGVTGDGSHYAIFQDADGVYGSCGLTRVAPKASYEATSPLIVTAACVGGERELLSMTRWRWQRRVPAIAALHGFHRDQMKDAPVRISLDRDTRVARIELMHQGIWYVVRTDESGGVTEMSTAERYGSPDLTGSSTWGGVTGFVRVENGYLLRLFHFPSLTWWDEAVVISDQEVVNVAGLRALARQKAEDATRRLREQHSSRSGVFVDAPAGPVNQLVRKRKRAAAARQAVRFWEQVAAYGALDEASTRDALWLLAWIDAPSRRLEALRWYLGLRDRNPAAAEALAKELEKEPDPAALVAYLRGSSDPLRHLPDVAGTLLTDEMLRDLSNQDLFWLHLAQWAAQGGYRFADGALAAYFAQFPWYAPIPEYDWPRWLSPAFRKSPDSLLLRAERCSSPADACKESLQAILRAEQTRGMAPPDVSLLERGRRSVR